ncbi:VWA domain-containing protein [Geoglobus ahangari]
MYPFSAIVGQEKMKKALILNAINPQIGGVLLRGDKGTGKSTAVRALAEVLPEIEVSGCAFSCTPDRLCQECAEKARKGELSFTKKRMRVVELPLSATEDMVVGTVDVESALKDGVVSFRPGILAEANNSILYIDEVNLLDDHLVDTLLDVAASGWNVVEREGVSVRHPSRFILVGTMNPEEGELRPQLLDRFGMVVDVRAITDPELRAEVVKRAEEFSEDPEGFRRKFEREQEALRRRIQMARELLREVEAGDEIVMAISKLCSELGIETHRADITTLRAAKAIAAYNGRRRVEVRDVVEAAELTLPHRVKSKPFESPRIEFDRVEELLNEFLDGEDDGSDGDSDREVPGRGERRFDASNASAPKFEVRSRRAGWKGKRVKSPSSSGRYVRFGLVGERLAIIPTLRAAFSGGRRAVLPHDFRYWRCSGKSVASIALVVDASGSMTALRRMQIAKGVLMSLLRDSYVRRDRVSLIVFRNGSAELVVPPTTSPQLAASRVGEMPAGGKTPLSAGLYRAYKLLRMEKRRGYVPILVLISDGRANVSLSGGDIKEEVVSICEAIAREDISTVLVDADDHVSLGFTREIAAITGAVHHRLRDLDAESIARVVNDVRRAV